MAEAPRADVIHHVINGGIKLIAAGISGLVGEPILSASQTSCDQTPLISWRRWMGMERHDAYLFVVTQIAAE